ncbi:MAG TPA: hypothetical protein VMZ51_08265 [Acidimicrobiales bacterium]|nr:hypothetical protein [Acidimicrobiales bacterium]
MSADDLHHADGTHRATAPSAGGTALARHEARMRAHLADGHGHLCPHDGAMTVEFRAPVFAVVNGTDVERVVIGDEYLTQADTVTCDHCGHLWTNLEHPPAPVTAALAVAADPSVMWPTWEWGW